MPHSSTAARVTPEGIDPALESNQSAEDGTPPEGKAPAAEGDPGVRGEAEPRDAAYVAAENFLTARDRGVTVPGPLPSPPETGQRHPSGGEGHGGGNEAGAGERPLSCGIGITGRCSSSVRRRLGGKAAGEARRCYFCSHGELPYRRKPGGDGAGTLAPPPNTAQRHPSNIWIDHVYAHWRSRGWEEHKRKTRSTARIWKGITSDENWVRGRHEPGASMSTRERRALPGPCREKGRQWRERTSQGRRGRRGRSSTKGRSATSRLHRRRPERYDLWRL